MKHVLEIEGLKKSYGRFALQDVSFTLDEDCITGFIGANGAGKTTTIRCLLGLARRDGGRIKLFGQEVGAGGCALRDRIGVVLDGGGFYESLTVGQMRSILAPAYSKWDEAAFRGCLERFSLDPKQKIATLSKGMHMQLALSFALSHHADLLLMDEPTSGLDPLVRREFLDLLLDYMRQGGKSVLFSTHITSDLDRIADEIILLDRGRVLFQEGRDELLDRWRMVKGSRAALTPRTRPLFRRLRETDYGFTGLTDQAGEARAALPGAVFERPAIEDIMVGCIEGGEWKC